MSNMDASVITKVKCPIAIEWPIAENHLREIKDKPGECLYSDRFGALNIPGVTYCLGIFPNEDFEGRQGETGIYLYLNNSDNLKIRVNFDIKIETANVSKKCKYNFTDASGHGKFFCTTKELFDPANRYIVDGQLSNKIDGILTVEKEMLTKDENLGNYSDALCLGLWNQDEDKNFTIVAGGKDIMAHKNVLATRSPVFARMFGSGLKEAQENQVTINDFSFQVVEMAIKFCYHHSLVTKSSLDDKMELLQFFDKYDIQPLKDDLGAYLASEICESTVCRLINASLISNTPVLQKKCTEFLRKCLRTKPIADFDLLDDDFAMNFLKNSFCHISK